ncbi:MAG: succinyl-diaminopimelate desuccinylase [Alphaproteobacteria bacterium]|nr:succinyl-diaminopimelate desuccinylase [Alphaproteobacteria bacterium]
MYALDLCQRLLKCPSITPKDAGAIAVVSEALKDLGFTCHVLSFSDPKSPPVNNLYGRIGTNRPHLCFAGHTDVVPVGDPAHWSFNPFAGYIEGELLYGRGAIDMKGAIACFIAASSAFLQDKGPTFKGSISLMITGDEEGPAVNGTVKILEWLKARNEIIDACLIGEPTSKTQIGDTVKIGRRGSLNAKIITHGTQGHVAYPELADNPIPRLLGFLTEISKTPLDQGSEDFPSSNLEITSIDVGNPASNVIPQAAYADFNIRYNNAHTGQGLIKWLEEVALKTAGKHTLTFNISGEPFRTPPGAFKNTVIKAIEKVTGHTPELSTSGGTSDGRFIHHHTPVIECGLKNATAHQIDEHVATQDLVILQKIYKEILERFFE